MKKQATKPKDLKVRKDGAVKGGSINGVVKGIGGALQGAAQV